MTTFRASRRVGAVASRVEGRLHLISTQAATHEVRGPEVVVIHDLETENTIRILAGQLEALEPDGLQALLLHTTLAIIPFDAHAREGVGRRRPLPKQLLVHRQQVLGPDDRDAQDVGGLVDL